VEQGHAVSGLPARLGRAQRTPGKRRDHLSNAFSLRGGQFLGSRQHVIIDGKSRPHGAYLRGSISHQSSYITNGRTSSGFPLIAVIGVDGFGVLDLLPLLSGPALLQLPLLRKIPPPAASRSQRRYEQSLGLEEREDHRARQREYHRRLKLKS